MFPSTSALVSSIIATFSVGIASILVFHPTVRSFVSPAQGVLAPTWALVVAQVHVGSVLADAVKSIIGCLVGAGCGIAAYALASLLPMDVNAQHEAATIMAAPLAFLIALADPVLGSPLGAWMKHDVASLTLYIVASFSKSNAYGSCVSAIVAFSFGSLCALTIAALARAVTDLGSTRRRIDDSLDAFSVAQTHWLEGLTAFMTSASGDHSNELDLRQNAASDALSAFQESLSLAKSSDPLQVLEFPDAAQNLSVVAVLMHSQLLAFRGTISPGSYRDDTLRATLNPILESFNRTRVSAVLALRPSTPARVRQNAHLALKAEASELYKSLINNAAMTASARFADLPQGDEVVRLHFATVSLIRFTLLVDRFLDTVGSATALARPGRSICLFLKEKGRNLFSKSAWKKTANFSHAFRSVIAQQVISQIALFIARVDPAEFGQVIIWAQLPVVFCFLPTFGGSLIKGSRRVIGTLVGGAVGCISAIAHPGSESSFWLEMILISFLGKVFSYHPKVGYAGAVFSFTWFICMLGSVTVLDSTTLLHAVLYRMVLTVCGVIASYVLSAVLFPAFSATKMRLAMGKAIATASQLVVDGIRGAVAGVPFDAREVLSGGSSGALCVACEGYTGAGDKALKSLHKYIATLPTLCLETRAEINFIKHLCCTGDNQLSTKSLADAEEALYRFIDSVLVLSATSAETRVTEYAHSLFFTEQVVFALNHFADKAELAGTRLSAAVLGEHYNISECYTGDRLDDVDRNLMAIRQILGQSRKLPEAVKGGSPLIYVFHFALCELADSWDDLVRALQGTPHTFANKPERFRRISSSHSSLNIL